jgi:hypothetical protein
MRLTLNAATIQYTRKTSQEIWMVAAMMIWARIVDYYVAGSKDVSAYRESQETHGTKKLVWRHDPRGWQQRLNFESGNEKATIRTLRKHREGCGTHTFLLASTWATCCAAISV